MAQNVKELKAPNMKNEGNKYKHKKLGTSLTKQAGLEPTFESRAVGSESQTAEVVQRKESSPADFRLTRWVVNNFSDEDRIVSMKDRGQIKLQCTIKMAKTSSLNNFSKLYG